MVYTLSHQEQVLGWKAQDEINKLGCADAPQSFKVPQGQLISPLKASELGVEG